MKGNTVDSSQRCYVVDQMRTAAEPREKRKYRGVRHVRWHCQYCRTRNMIRIIVFSLSAIAASIVPQHSQAQDRLAKLSLEQKKADYYVILQKVFHRIYGPDVTLAELFAPGTGAAESAAGVLTTVKGYEAFALFSSPSVWQTEYRRFLRGTEEHCVDDAGESIPCPGESRSKGAVKSYGDIKVIMKRRVLSAAVAGRLAGVWKQRVRKALQQPAFSEYENFRGGLKHYYSMRLRDGNWVTILGQSYDENSEAGRMAALARELRGYALGVVSEAELTRVLTRVEKTPVSH